MNRDAGPARGRFVRGPQDVLAGLMVIGIGAFVLAVLSRVRAVSYSSISPTLFPNLCSIGLVLGGLALAARGLLRDGPGLERLPLRPLLLVTLAIVLFGLITPQFGYVPGGLATMLVAGLAAPDLRPLQLLLTAIGLVAFSVALFTGLLKLTVPVFVLPALLG